jgi:hypothetical protein
LRAQGSMIETIGERFRVHNRETSRGPFLLREFSAGLRKCPT